MRPESDTKLPVPPRPAGPTETSASESALEVPPEAVPSMALAATFKPISLSCGSSKRAAVIGHERKRPKPAIFPQALNALLKTSRFRLVHLHHTRRTRRLYVYIVGWGCTRRLQVRTRATTSHCRHINAAGTFANFIVHAGTWPQRENVKHKRQNCRSTTNHTTNLRS